MHTLHLISAKGLPCQGEATRVRERAKGEPVHLWKDKGQALNGACAKCHAPLGRLSGSPWVESEERWDAHPSKCERTL